MMSRKLVIITEIIAPYRIPVFNVLARLPGIDLHVIFLAKTDPTLRRWAVYENEIRFEYEVLRSYRLRWRGHGFLVNLGVFPALRRCAPDSIVCGGYNYVASWQALLWARHHGISFFLWTESNARDSRNNNFLTRAVKKIFLRRCVGFVVPGQSSRRYLRDFNVPESKIFTAPNAVDADLFAHKADFVRSEAATWRQTLNLPPRFFLFVGRIVVEKGVFDLLGAYGTLNRDLRAEIGLVFVGDGPARAELEDKAKILGEASAVQFRGFIQRDELPAFYALAEGFVLPTHSDTWGLVINEAMTCGLPIICSDVAGCAEDLVEDGRNGYIVPARNPEQLAAALNKLARNPESFRMGENSRSRISHYSPEACARGIAQAAFSARHNA